MSTITKEFTKEQLQQIEAAAKEVLWPVVWSEKKAREHFSEKITPKVVLKLARIALASLGAEPVAYSLIFRNMDGVLNDYVNANTTFSTIEKAQAYGRGGNYVRQNDGSLKWVSDPSLDPVVVPLYTTPPAPAKSDPVAWLWSHRKHPSEVSLVRPEDDERAEGAHWSGWSCQALYAAPPAPVSVPDESAVELLATDLMQRIDNITGERHSAATLSSLRVSIVEACRAAMLNQEKSNG